MEEAEIIKLIVSLILAKVEILNLKTKNGGYDYSFTSEEDKKQVEETLEKINNLLSELKYK